MRGSYSGVAYDDVTFDVQPEALMLLPGVGAPRQLHAVRHARDVVVPRQSPAA